MRSSFRRALLPAAVALGGAALPVACYAPTGLELRLDTDECARAGETFETGVFVGGSRVDDLPRTTTNACDVARAPKIGSLVLVPDGDRDAQVRLEVVLAVNATAEECRASGYVLADPARPVAGPRRGCVVQKRRLGFRPHKTATVGIALNQARCLNVACGEGTTCGRDGTCVPDDCRGGSCEESFTGVVVDGGLPDAAVDVDGGLPGSRVVYRGAADILGGLHHVSDDVLVFGEGTAKASQVITYDVTAAAVRQAENVPDLVQVLASPEDPPVRVALTGVGGVYQVQHWNVIGGPTFAPLNVDGRTPSLARARGTFGVAYTAPAGGKGYWMPIGSGIGGVEDLVGEPFVAAGEDLYLTYLGVAPGPTRVPYYFGGSKSNAALDVGGAVDAPFTYAQSVLHAAQGDTIVSALVQLPTVTDVYALGATPRALQADGRDVFFATDFAVGFVRPSPGTATFVKPAPTILAVRTIPRKQTFLTVTGKAVYWTEGNEIHAVAR